MEEITLGEYIRTKNGKIIKCTGFGTFRKDGQNNRVKTIISGRSHYIYDYIVKHSQNIIDLIQEDDVGIMNCYGLLVKKFITESDILELKLGNYELLKVVTKEQFEKVEYKLDN